MYNDFVIVGPAKDPTGLGKLHDAAKALQAIKEKGQTFISRGDESGTHIKEKTLWQAPTSSLSSPATSPSARHGADPDHGFELGAYTLTDRGTWLAYQSKLDLAVLLEGTSGCSTPIR